MTDALITELSKIGTLKVLSSASVMQYKEFSKTLPEKLNVDAVIEGSVQRADERVPIAVRLFHVSTETQIWTESFQRDFTDIFTLQHEVASAIAREIPAELTLQEQARLADERTPNREAYKAYLRGRYWSRTCPESLQRA
jgi:TolB-like protein